MLEVQVEEQIMLQVVQVVQVEEEQDLLLHK
jgi:hypothetical protein